MYLSKKMKTIPNCPFKCPKCGEEIKRWADLGCHWSDELHCVGVKKCPNPPRTKRALKRALIEITGRHDDELPTLC